MKVDLLLKRYLILVIVLTVNVFCFANENAVEKLKRLIGEKSTQAILSETKKSFDAERLVELKNTINNGDWEAYLNPYNILAFFETEDHLWFGSTGGILKICKTDLTYEILNNNDLGVSFNNISAMNIAPNGDMWLGYQSNPGNDYSQEGGVSVIKTNGTILNYNRSNSDLKGNIITDFLFNTDGSIWISYGLRNPEYGGLSIINENGDWTHLNSLNSNLPGNTISSMYLDSQDRIWICLFGDFSQEYNEYINNGLIMVQDDNWTHFTTEIIDYEAYTDDDGNQHPKSWSITNIVEDSQGNLWFTLNNRGSRDNQVGLFKYDNYEFTSYGQEIYDDIFMFWHLTIDNDDRIWINGLWDKIACFDNGQWSLFSTEMIIQNIIADSNNRVWACFYGSYLGYFENDDIVFVEYELNDIPLKYNFINRIACNESKTYIATGEFGTYFSEYNSLIVKDNDSWIDYGIETFATYGAHDIKFDINNNIIVATGPTPPWHELASAHNLFGGVAVFENGIWANHTSITTGFPFVWSNTASRDIYGNLWASGFPSGLAYLNTGSAWQIIEGLHTEVVLDIVSDETSPVLWMATPFGLQKVYVSQSGFSGYEIFHPGNSSLPDVFVNQVYIDSSGKVWIATKRGLASYSNGLIENYNSIVGNLAINCLTEDEYGKLWIGTDKNGIIVLNNNMEITYLNTQNSPLPTNNITSISSDNNGKLWVGPYANGVYIYSYDYNSNLYEGNIEYVKNMPDIYPNPFNPQTTFQFELSKPGLVNIEIFNVKGQKVKSLVNDEFNNGVHKIIWDGTGDNQKQLSSGVYFSKITHSGQIAIKKILLLK